MPAALFSETRQRVLALFFMRPEERYYVREVARLTRKAVTTVQGELASLEEAGVLTKTTSGNRAYYQANAESPIFSELRSIVVKTVGLVDVLRRRLRPLSGGIDAAFVYGSMAGGKAGPQSDVDLMVVGEVDEMKLHSAVGRAERTLDRTVNYSLMDAAEFVRRRAEGEGFLSRVLDGPILTVLGDPDEIR